MTTKILALPEIGKLHMRLPKPGKLTALFLLCCLADFLFFDQAFGISIPIFFLAATLISFATNKKMVSKRKTIICAMLAFASLIPSFNDTSFLTILIALTGTISVAILLRTTGRIDLEQMSYALLAQLLRLPIEFLGVLPRIQKSIRIKKMKSVSTTNWGLYVLPCLMAVFFIAIFAHANPIIGGWISQIDFDYLLKFMTLEKFFFWLFAATISWPFIRPFVRKWYEKQIQTTTVPEQQSKWLNEQNIAMTLVMFNAVFAVQTLLDITFIWGGTKLPAGVTYSEYVHQGTYILILTSLLAAAFILYATHRKRNFQNNRFVKIMLLAWTAQNVLLVLSTMSRMEIYIADYSLTEMRIWALVWMLLVIIGLILIFMKLFLNHDNDWLIKGNILSLAFTLYAMSFVNLPYQIADYNLNIAKPRLVELDTRYIRRLGPQTLPAIDHYLQNAVHGYQYRTKRVTKLQNLRSRFTNQIKRNTIGWRQWNYQRHWLRTYIANAGTNID